MEMFDVSLAGANYKLRIENEYAFIEEYEGTKTELLIPSKIDEYYINGIGKKAFFNSRGLRRVYIPETVTKIGDWAFSHCLDLEEVYLKKQTYDLGKNIFDDCERLKKICLWEDDSDMSCHEGFGSLLCATTGILDADYLFQTEKIDDEEWLELWDKRMLSILHEDDMEGYTKLLLCGEEDYGSSENNLDIFLENKRKRKVRLAYLRLIYDKMLAIANREELEQYILNHTVGCESMESFLVLKEEYGDNPDYINLFFELGCATLENFNEILHHIGEDCPQLKAYMLRYKEEKLGERDFFQSLSLDDL